MPENKFSEMLGKIQEIQKKIVKAKEDLRRKVVEGSAGGGMVKVRMNGEFEIEDILIEDEIFTGDPEMLKDLIIAAFNDAVARVRDLIANDMREITGGMNIPGLF